MVRLFFSADLHLGHMNIIKYCNRPFDSVEAMNKKLIANWNRRVGKYDQVIFLGDFCFGDPEPYLKKLHGNIVFVKGNHDDERSLDAMIPYLVVQLTDEIEAFCIHRPEDFFSNYHINLTAHVHQKWASKTIYHTILVNVGVDVNNYRPMSVDDVLQVVKKAELEKKRFMAKLKRKRKR